MESEPLEQQIINFKSSFKSLEDELKKVMVGVDDVIVTVLSAVFAGGHVLLEGVPGLGKTLLVKSLATTLGLSFKRIQFTPDLMPSDATGTQVLTEDQTGKRVFQFKPGPLFANIVLADEINRATPKTQSALLEAMEEKQVTVLGERHILPHPFFVLATQNPVELEGTYPLPEAQLDRFMAKVIVPAPSSTVLKEILARTTGSSIPEVTGVFPESDSSALILKYRSLIRSVVVAEPLQDVIVRIISALTPGNQYQTKLVSKYLRFGPGPRGAQSLILLAKAHALLDGRINLAFEDIRSVLVPTLRHRLIVNFQAEADGISTDAILNEIKTAK
jgi:MoxR-like ATPase